MMFLFADGMVVPQTMASVVAGLAAAVFVWWLIGVLRSEDIEQGIEWRYDVSRINELRRLSVFYRVFQPAIGLFARLNRAAFREGLPEIQREIQAAGLPRFWLAEEYLARCQLIAIFCTPAFAYLCRGMGVAGVMTTGVMVVAAAWWLRRRLARRAKYRLRQIILRMPFLLDHLTLLMEAGATFLDALKQAVDEFEGHAVAEEFGRVLADINMGKTRVEAFQALRDRLADDEISSIIGFVLQGEKLGTPLAGIFRTQANVLRVKRSQRAETIAGEAGVNMLLPAVLVMVSTALVIIGPIVLYYLKFDLSLEG